MGEVIKKRKQLTINEKLNFIEKIDAGRRMSVVAREYGISSSTASGIVKDRSKILFTQNHYKLNSNRKRVRLSLYSDIDEAVYMWFKQMRAKNKPVNGPLIQQKAREFAQLLGHKNFEGSSGWLSRFRDRHDMSVEAMRGPENSAYDMSYEGMTDEEIVSCITHNKNPKQEAEYIIAEVDLPVLKNDKHESNHENAVNHDVAYNSNNYNSENDFVYNTNHNSAHISNNDIVYSVNNNDMHGFDNKIVYNTNNNEDCNLNNGTVCELNNDMKCNSYCATRLQAISSGNDIAQYKTSSSGNQSTRRSDSRRKTNLTHNSCKTSTTSTKPSDAVSLVEKLTFFFKEQTDVPKNIWDSLQNINDFIKGDLSERLKQKRITDFFIKLNKS